MEKKKNEKPGAPVTLIRSVMLLVLGAQQLLLKPDGHTASAGL